MSINCVKSILCQNNLQLHQNSPLFPASALEEGSYRYWIFSSVVCTKAENVFRIPHYLANIFMTRTITTYNVYLIHIEHYRTHHSGSNDDDEDEGASTERQKQQRRRAAITGGPTRAINVRTHRGVDRRPSALARLLKVTGEPQESWSGHNRQD